MPFTVMNSTEIHCRHCISASGVIFSPASGCQQWLVSLLAMVRGYSTLHTLYYAMLSSPFQCSALQCMDELVVDKWCLIWPESWALTNHTDGRAGSWKERKGEKWGERWTEGRSVMTNTTEGSFVFGHV